MARIFELAQLLVKYEAVVDLIEGTKARSGLRALTKFSRRGHPAGTRLSDAGWGRVYLRPALPIIRSLVLLLLASVACVAQLSKDPRQIEQGRNTFRVWCSSCHGMHARGGRGPDLTRRNYENGNRDSDLFRVITQGVFGTDMQAFSGDLSPNEIWQVISYLRSITVPAAGLVPGDRTRGEKLFWGKGGCGRCHTVGNHGGLLGPDLSRIGAERSVAYLRQSILSPSPDITPGYSTVSIVTRDGRRITGVAKNLDNFFLELVGVNGKAYSFRRSQLTSVTSEALSLMPDAYGQLFSAAELNDVTAYLASLRGATPGAPPRIDLTKLDDSTLLEAQSDPAKWLMYDRNYAGWRYSPLAQINTGNVAHLRPQWTFQTGAPGRIESTPLVLEGVMYLTGYSNHAWAIDLRSGQTRWHYYDAPPQRLHLCCGEVNRGFAMLGNRLFKVDIEGELIALDAPTGRVIWKVRLGDYRKGFSATGAPLVVKNKVLVGSAGADFGVRGFIDAYDAWDGKRCWRFYTVPAPGEPGSGTWPADGWQHGGGTTWGTGTYDPELNLVYWGTGNPAPDLGGDVRPGANLYTCSLLALDSDTGKLKWYFQFTPHDTHDWDAVADPVLVDVLFHGRPVRAVIQADRNGIFYALDRTNGKLMLAKAYTKVSWARGIGGDGKPILVPGQEPTEGGNEVCPGMGGGHDWEPAAFSPQTHLYYFSSTEGCDVYYKTREAYVPGRLFQASAANDVPGEPKKASIIALDPSTGNVKWRYEMTGCSAAGMLATAGGLVFTGDSQGYVFALDARTGKILWYYQAGGPIATAPVTYTLDGKQYVAVASGSDLVTFALSSQESD
jgi:alcohol dehydrogenase (cytochrome c)